MSRNICFHILMTHKKCTPSQNVGWWHMFAQISSKHMFVQKYVYLNVGFSIFSQIRHRKKSQSFISLNTRSTFRWSLSLCHLQTNYKIKWHINYLDFLCQLKKLLSGGRNAFVSILDGNSSQSIISISSRCKIWWYVSSIARYDFYIIFWYTDGDDNDDDYGYFDYGFHGDGKAPRTVEMSLDWFYFDAGTCETSERPMDNHRLHDQAAATRKRRGRRRQRNGRNILVLFGDCKSPCIGGFEFDLFWKNNNKKKVKRCLASPQAQAQTKRAKPEWTTIASTNNNSNTTRRGRRRKMGICFYYFWTANESIHDIFYWLGKGKKM